MSARIKDQLARRVLDSAARQRRARKALESLEQDNSHEDPHADLVMSKKALSLFQVPYKWSTPSTGNMKDINGPSDFPSSEVTAFLLSIAT
jgi:zinc finger HIT domain-containing protein 1